MARPRTRVPLRTLVDGFDNARLRFETVAGGADADAKFIALFEVVAWGGALYDWFKKREKRSKTKRGIPPDALALWFVRNRVLHYGAEALFQMTTLRPQPLVVLANSGSRLFGPTVVWSPPTWRPSRRMPKGTGNVGKKEYDSLFANKPITETLAHVAATLRGRTR
jgi:hypothetical protein